MHKMCIHPIALTIPYRVVDPTLLDLELLDCCKLEQLKNILHPPCDVRFTHCKLSLDEQVRLLESVGSQAK